MLNSVFSDQIFETITVIGEMVRYICYYFLFNMAVYNMSNDIIAGVSYTGRNIHIQLTFLQIIFPSILRS